MEFRLLTNIKYKDKRFMVLSSKKHQKFFLRILEDNSLIYPTLEEFSKLYKIFTINAESSKVLYEIEKNDLIDKKNKTKFYKFIPKVIFEGALISLASAMLLSGCGTSIASEIKTEEQSNIAVGVSSELVGKEDNTNREEQLNSHIYGNESSESEFEKMKNEISNSIYQFDVKELPEEVLLCHSYVNDNSQKITFSDTMDEFKKYVEMKNPTYSSLKYALNQNENIPNKYKEILEKGIDNLEKELPNLDLSVLYYNLNRIKVYDDESTDFDEELTDNLSGYFRPKEGIIMVKSDESEEVILHEVLGHGCTEAYIPEENLSQSMSATIVSIEDDEFQETMSITNLGCSLEEGKADMIAAIAKGESIDNTARYVTEIEQLRIYMETTNTSLEELTKYGISNLILKMKQNDVDKPITYIENIDFLLNVTINQDIYTEIPNEVLTENNVNDFFVDYFDDKLNSGMKKDEAKKIVQDIMDRSDFLEITAQNGDYKADSVNAQELTQHIIENIENIKVTPKTLNESGKNKDSDEISK